MNDVKRTTIGLLPTDWKLKKIKDVCETISGGTPSRSKPEYYESGTVPWIKTGELNQKYIFDTKEKITEAAVKQSSAKLVPKNSVLMAMYGATIGKTSITKIEATTNQACCAMISKGKLEPEFLYYVLSSNKDKIIALGAGGAQPNISLQIIREIEIPFPTQEEQQEIASILSSVDEAIRKTEVIIEQTEKMKKGLMQQLLTKGVGHTEFKKTKIGKIPESWQVVFLGEIMKYHIRKVSVVDQKIYQLLGVRWYANGTHIHSIKHGTELKTKTVYKIEKDDIVYNRMWPTKGAFTVVEEDCEDTYATNEYPTFVPVKDKLYVRYIKHIMFTNKFWENASAFAKGTTGRARLHQDDFLKLRIALPPIEEQMKIVSILDCTDSKLVIEKRKYARLLDIKNGLMQSLMTGEIRVNVKGNENENEVIQV